VVIVGKGEGYNFLRGKGGKYVVVKQKIELLLKQLQLEMTKFKDTLLRWALYGGKNDENGV
jgi:hypothetical protein